MEIDSEIVADFYRHLKNFDVDETNNNQLIHKLNFQILYNPINTPQTWVEDMLLFAFQMIHLDFQQVNGFAIFTQKHHPFNMSDDSKTFFYHILDVLIQHFNSLVPAHKFINDKMFYELMDAKEIRLKTPIYPEN